LVSGVSAKAMLVNNVAEMDMTSQKFGHPPVQGLNM